MNGPKPEPSTSIFRDYKDRSFKVALYNSTERYSGITGNNPTVEVIMQKIPLTKVYCGYQNGTKFISFTNMFVSMGRVRNEDLNGRIGDESIDLEKYFTDDL
jgi:hypothetical protein